MYPLPSGSPGAFTYLYTHRPLIQGKLKVLHQAGLAGEDFSKTESTSVAVSIKKYMFSI